jgi:hypothetical protein
MPLRKADSLRNAQAAAVTTLLDAGSGAGYAQIRTGSQPATPATAVSGTLLATVTLADPAFGSPSSGVATLADPASVTGVADGTAGWARFFDSTGAVVFDGDVTVTGGSGVLRLSSLSITTGGAVDITGGTWTVPM